MTPTQASFLNGSGIVVGALFLLMGIWIIAASLRSRQMSLGEGAGAIFIGFVVLLSGIGILLGVHILPVVPTAVG